MESLQPQQVAVSVNNPISLAIYGTFQHPIVRFVSTYCHSTIRQNDFSQVPDSSNNPLCFFFRELKGLITSNQNFF